MEWPKRARTVNWESGVLTLDGEKQFEIPELTAESMEQLAAYTLVGFHVKGYPVTDELLAPFAGHKSMANFGVEDGALTDACFPVFSTMPKSRYLLLDGNAAIHGSGLSALQGCKLDLLTLNRTELDDAGLLQAASIPKLSHIQIDHTAVTYEGLLAIAGNSRIEPVAHVQFTKEQMEHFKYAIVLLGNWHKFSQNRELREFLLSTGDSALVEASPYDNIWGIRLSANSPEARDPFKWRGQNLLGFALMEVRDELRRVTQNEMLCDWSMVWQQ